MTNLCWLFCSAHFSDSMAEVLRKFCTDAYSVSVLAFIVTVTYAKMLQALDMMQNLQDI